MDNNLIVNALIWIAALVWAALLANKGWIIPKSFFDPIGIVTMAVTTLLFMFDKWLWKLSPLQRILKRPDLTGTWSGVLRSQYLDPTTGTRIPDIPAFLIITQSFSTLHIAMLTRESRSRTLSAAVRPNDDGSLEVFGVYKNEPKLSARNRSPIHNGGFALNVTRSDWSRLDGHYWTDRDTSGETDLTRVSRKKATDFEAAAALRGH